MEARKVWPLLRILYRNVYERPQFVGRTKPSFIPSWRFDAAIIGACLFLALRYFF